MNGTIKSERYVHQPERLVTKSSIPRLNRRLKESPKVWNNTFNEWAMKRNFKRTSHDYYLYCKYDVRAIVYVFDLLATGEIIKVEEILMLLKKQFVVRDMGELKHFRRMTITRKGNTLKNLKRMIIHNFNMVQHNSTNLRAFPCMYSNLVFL